VPSPSSGERPGRRPTLKDVAAETGLSVTAVSYALRGLHGSESTRRRAADAAARLGYEADPIARALASGTSGVVGVLCGSLTDLWQQRLAAGLGRALFASGRGGLIVDAAGDSQHQLALAEKLVQQRVDALVVIPLDPLTRAWKRVADEVGVITVGDELVHASTRSAVLFDDSTAVSHALEEVAARGHQVVSLLTPEKSSRRRRPVEQAAADESRRHGIAISMTACSYELHEAAAVVERLLQSAQPPTAVVAMADSMAYGAYSAARSLGLSIPRDLSVIGFDDHPMSALLTPALTSYRWPLETIVDAILERVEARTVDDVLLEAEPHARDSVGPPPS